MKRELKKIAKKIAELERKVQNGSVDSKTGMIEIDKLVEDLLPDDLLEIDNYIQEKKLLTN